VGFETASGSRGFCTRTGPLQAGQLAGLLTSGSGSETGYHVDERQWWTSAGDT